VTEQIIFLL